MKPNSLNARIDVYGGTECTNSLGETDYTYSKIKTVWAQIMPTGGSEKSAAANSAYAEITHKVILRKYAVPELKNDMYFMFEGQRYDVKYFYPNYKTGDSIDVFCVLVVE